MKFVEEIDCRDYHIVFATKSVGDRLNAKKVHIVQSGEHAKTMEGLAKVLQILQEEKIQRGNRILAVGGGTVLDKVGLASALFKRGVSVSYAPTTLLAMVDAAVGGKTAVNLKGKNMAGVFYQPSQILVDVKMLDSLPPNQVANGLSQAIKTVYLFDQPYFQKLCSFQPRDIRRQLPTLIRRCCQLKQDIVRKDPKQSGIRKYLNFGHTLGHALQSMGCGLLHGECVAIGMVFSNKINDKEDLRLQNILRKYKLPTAVPLQARPDDLLKQMYNDKKTTGGIINFVVRGQNGQPEMKQVDENTILQHLGQHVEIAGCCPVDQVLQAPRSKSLSNRYLFLAAVQQIAGATQPITIKHLLLSEDTLLMLDCIRTLGVQVQLNGNTAVVKKHTPRAGGRLQVGNSGITARFVLALCSVLPGRWQICCSERMKARPNGQMFKVLGEYCDLQFLQQQDCLPVAVTLRKKSSYFRVDGRLSSQFLSAFLLISPLVPQFTLEVANQKQGQLVSQSFFQMSIKLLEYSNLKVEWNGSTVTVAGRFKLPAQIEVEQDMASRSYLTAFNQIFNLKKYPPPQSSLQGDAQFYQHLFSLSGDTSSVVKIDFNNCTDTFMTLACTFPFITTKAVQLVLQGIGNQRVKQSDRIHAIARVLLAMGVRVKLQQDKITISKWSQINVNPLVIVDTYDDHRIAMAATLAAAFVKTNLPTVRIIILNKQCVSKTFPNFWRVMQQYGVILKYLGNTDLLQVKKENGLLIGQRGSGKSTLAKILPNSIDIDQQLKKVHGIDLAKFVQEKGWKTFRQAQLGLVFQNLFNHKWVVPGAGFMAIEQSRALVENMRMTGEVVQVYREDRVPPPIDQNRPSLPQNQNQPSRQILYNRMTTSFYSWHQKTNLKPINNVTQCTFFQHLVDGTLKVQEGVDLIQLRMDRFLMNTEIEQQKLAAILNKVEKPILLTLRTKAQGGYYQKDYWNAIKMLDKMPVAYLDIQLQQVGKSLFSFSKYKNYLISHHLRKQNIQFILPKMKNIGRPYKLLVQEGGLQKWAAAKNLVGTDPNSWVCSLQGDPLTRMNQKLVMGGWGNYWPSNMPSINFISKLTRALL